MDLHLVLDRTSPLRHQLERELREAIRAGRLRAGSKLPSSRDLADELGLSRGVVVEAYSQLIAEGYLLARRGHGTRVADGLAHQPPALRVSSRTESRIRYDLRSGVPDFSFFPRREWQAASTIALRELPDMSLAYGSPRGLRRLRTALADYLGRVRAVVADPGRMLITPGATSGLGVLLLALRERGATRIAVEDPAWPAIPDTVAQAGIDVIPIAVDEAGLRISDLRDARADAVILSPAHQYPTGAVLEPERRAELIAWARSGGKLIVEDDYDAEYRYDHQPIAALQGLAPDCVAYVGTTSKTLAPGLRLAWLLVPSHLVGDVSAQQVITRAAPSALVQATYATMLERGDIDRHLRRTRRRYHARRNTLVGALTRWLPQARIAGASAGLHLIAWLPADDDELAIADAAAKRGVAIHTLHRDCAVTVPTGPALLLGYGLTPEPAIPRAVRELATATAR